MNGIRLLIVVLALSSWSCETLQQDGSPKEKAEPKSLRDIDVSDLPEEYSPNLRPVIAYFVDEMTNSQFTFADQIGDYRVELFHSNSYRFTATAKDKSRSDIREGVWRWYRVGPDQGFLMLGNRRWFLNFTTLEKATATTKGDNRTFQLEFSHM